MHAPYHPASNGEAERFVQTFKRSLRAGKGDPGTVPQKLAQFLLTYRTTPNATTGVTPAELFLKRKVQTRLDLLKPSVEDYVYEKQMQQHDEHCRDRSYGVGQFVLVRNLRYGPNWVVGLVFCLLTESINKVLKWRTKCFKCGSISGNPLLVNNLFNISSSK